MAEHGAGEVVPPADVTAGWLRTQVRDRLRDELTARILAEADLEGQVEDAVATLAGELDARSGGLAGRVRTGLADEPARSSADPSRRRPARWSTATSSTGADLMAEHDEVLSWAKTPQDRSKSTLPQSW